MARVRQGVKHTVRRRTKKNGKSRGTARRIKVSKTQRINQGGRVTVKRQSYSGKPSRMPKFSGW